jgi:hypothetical protein
MNVIGKVGSIVQNVKKGFKTADQIQADLIAQQKEKGVGYGQSVLDPRFKQEIAKAGITARETPAQFLGAYASRATIDVANDGTRTYWWRYNHPLAIAQKGLEQGINRDLIQSPTARAAVALGVAVPAIAAAGTYDITNPEEQFRPKGYSQTYAEKGSQDRRQTSQPVQELFERFFLGRTGDPLKYETAKQDIPSLTPQRYANYQNFLYNEKGLLGLGIIKATPENLEGKPELRMLGFPATIPMAGGFAGGTVAATVAGRTGTTPRQRAVRAMVGGLTGSIGGVAGGNVVNEVIASANRPQLPTIQEYQSTSPDRI